MRRKSFLQLFGSLTILVIVPKKMELKKKLYLFYIQSPIGLLPINTKYISNKEYGITESTIRF